MQAVARHTRAKDSESVVTHSDNGVVMQIEFDQNEDVISAFYCDELEHGLTKTGRKRDTLGISKRNIPRGGEALGISSNGDDRMEPKV